MLAARDMECVVRHIMLHASDEGDTCALGRVVTTDATPLRGTDEPKDVRRRLSRRHTDPGRLAPGVEHRECRHLGVGIIGGLGAGTGNNHFLARRTNVTQANCQQTAAKLTQTAQRPKGQSRRRESAAATANPGGTQQWQVHKTEQVRLRSDLSADWNALPNSKKIATIPRSV